MSADQIRSVPPDQRIKANLNGVLVGQRSDAFLMQLTDYWRRVQVAAALESLKDQRDGSEEEGEGNIIRAPFPHAKFMAGECPAPVHERAFARVDADQRKAYEKALKRNPRLPAPEPTEHIAVVFSPFALRIKGERDLLHVLYGNATVNRFGKMRTADVNSDLPPVWVGRACLEPSDGIEDALFPLAEADRYYDAIAAKLAHLGIWPSDWNVVLDVCDEIWAKSAESDAVPLLQALAQRYDVLPGWIRFEENDSKRLTIVRMYEKIAACIADASTPVLYREAALAEHRRRFDKPGSALHLGNMAADNSLAPSQRDSLHAYLQTPPGHIAAVNGPPGTGKTTLLQSVVATEMVARAVAGLDAPLFIAAAATNQAVSNILKAFGEATEISTMHWPTDGFPASVVATAFIFADRRAKVRRWHAGRSFVLQQTLRDIARMTRKQSSA